MVLAMLDYGRITSAPLLNCTVLVRAIRLQRFQYREFNFIMNANYLCESPQDPANYLHTVRLFGASLWRTMPGLLRMHSNLITRCAVVCTKLKLKALSEVPEQWEYLRARVDITFIKPWVETVPPVSAML